ncbi:MAG: tail fiber protein, partial [Gammaproteobacteria bacterium]|nr:tail fiber protein [Gammaproteobacteria bacterium]
MKKIFTVILMMLTLTCSLAFGQTYENYNPTADKVLQPDGSIVSIISGTTWAPADATRANQYRTMPVIAAKYLMPDGSIINGVPITTTITGTAIAGYCVMVNAAGGLVYESCPGAAGIAADTIWNVMGDMAIATGPDAANIANIGEQRVVGRLTGENVKGLALAEMKTLLGYPTFGEYQVNLGLLAGTLTDGFLCTYTATGTLLDCNTNPASFQPAGSYQADMGITAKSDSVSTTSSTSVASSTAVKTAYDLADGRQVNLGLVAGTLTNGFICTYTSAGTLLDCNTNPGVFQADMGITGRTDSTSTTSSTLVATATAVKSAYDLAGAAATAANWPGSAASPPAIGKTTPAELWGSPNVSKGPAIISSGFAGTISRATTTLTFSAVADAILAGYSATNPILGTTVIHPTGPVTMYITAWIGATSCTVDS